MQRIEREVILEHDNKVDDHCHDKVCHQQVQRIGLPGHLLAADSPPDCERDESVYGIEQSIQERLLVGYHPGEITSHWHADQPADQQRHSDLQP